jgi:hypothetical protein
MRSVWWRQQDKVMTTDATISEMTRIIASTATRISGAPPIVLFSQRHAQGVVKLSTKFTGLRLAELLVTSSTVAQQMLPG